MTTLEEEPIAVLTLTGASSGTGVKFKRYSEGDVLIRQGDDCAYLTAQQYAILQNFMKNGA